MTLGEFRDAILAAGISWDIEMFIESDPDKLSSIEHIYLEPDLLELKLYQKFPKNNKENVYRALLCAGNPTSPVLLKDLKLLVFQPHSFSVLSAISLI